MVVAIGAIVLVAGVMFIYASGYFTGKSNSEVSAIFLSVLGVILLILGLFGIVVNFETGKPITSIGAGTYDVKYVYIDDEVNLGIEFEHLGSGENYLRHYRFSKEAFDGEVDLDATSLVVVQSGSFKKLKLE